MRRQYRSFVVTMVVVSLCCGFVGCKLTPGGKWYKPTSYSLYNPFKKGYSEENEYGRYAEENNGIRMPSRDQTPSDLDLSPPAGGYSRDQVAQNTNRSSNVNVPNGSNVGGYPPPNPNSSVAMNPPPNQQVNYQGQPNYPNNAPQGPYYPNQPPQNQYSPNYGGQGGMTQTTTNPPQNTNYSTSSGSQPQYDTSYNTSQVPGGYTTGSYYDEYRPGGSRL